MTLPLYFLAVLCIIASCTNEEVPNISTKDKSVPVKVISCFNIPFTTSNAGAGTSDLVDAYTLSTLAPCVSNLVSIRRLINRNRDNTPIPIVRS